MKEFNKNTKEPWMCSTRESESAVLLWKGCMTGTGNMGARDLVISLREVRRDSLESAAIGVGE